MIKYMAIMNRESFLGRVTNIIQRSTQFVFAHLIFNFYYRINYQLKVYGKDNIPKTKDKYLVVSNHFSYNDPGLLVRTIKKPLVFLAKQELFTGKFFFVLLIRMLNAIPVDRDIPKKTTIQRFKNDTNYGWTGALFIEGTRNQSREKMTKLTTGAAFFARMLGKIDLLPVGIIGGEEKGDEFIINIGKPIPFDSSISLEELSVRYGKEIARLAHLKLEPEDEKFAQYL